MAHPLKSFPGSELLLANSDRLSGDSTTTSYSSALCLKCAIPADVNLPWPTHPLFTYKLLAVSCRYSINLSLSPIPHPRGDPADPSGFIDVDYFLGRNFSLSITLQKTQYQKVLATLAWWHSTLVVISSKLYAMNMKPKKSSRCHQTTPHGCLDTRLHHPELDSVALFLLMFLFFQLHGFYLTAIAVESTYCKLKKFQH